MIWNTVLSPIEFSERKRPLDNATQTKNTSKSYSTLLHSFVILPVSETIFGMSGCFPVSQGQEMKDLTASSGRKATRGCQCSFSAQVRLKNSHEY